MQARVGGSLASFRGICVETLSAMSFRQKSSEYSSILACEAITFFAAKAEQMQCAPIRGHPEEPRKCVLWQNRRLSETNLWQTVQLWRWSARQNPRKQPGKLQTITNNANAFLIRSAAGVITRPRLIRLVFSSR